MSFETTSAPVSGAPRPHLPDPDDVAGTAYVAGVQPDLEYRGGQVLSKPEFVSVYYGSYWGSTGGRRDMAYEDAFAKSLMSSKYMSVWAQYGVGKGKFLGSTWANPVGTVKSVTEAKIQQIVAQQIAAGKVAKPDGRTVYTVFLPPNAVLKADGVSSLDGLGGYHGSYDDPVSGKRVYYAAIAFSEGNNGIDFDGVARDNISITASHEWTEAATDPDVNNGELGWYDDNYGEVADVPMNQGMSVEDVYGRLGGYAVQKLWSEVDGKNELSAEHPGRVVKPK